MGGDAPISIFPREGGRGKRELDSGFCRNDGYAKVSAMGEMGVRGGGFPPARE